MSEKDLRSLDDILDLVIFHISLWALVTRLFCNYLLGFVSLDLEASQFSSFLYFVVFIRFFSMKV